MKVEDVLEILSIPLLGIVPESGEVLRSSNVGAPVTLGSPGSAPAQAYLEAARRLKGERTETVIVASTGRACCTGCSPDERHKPVQPTCRGDQRLSG